MQYVCKKRKAKYANLLLHFIVERMTCNIYCCLDTCQIGFRYFNSEATYSNATVRKDWNFKAFSHLKNNLKVQNLRVGLGIRNERITLKSCETREDTYKYTTMYIL